MNAREGNTHQKRRGERGKPTKSMKWRGKKSYKSKDENAIPQRSIRERKKGGECKVTRTCNSREKGENREESILQISIRERRQGDNAIPQRKIREKTWRQCPL